MTMPASVARDPIKRREWILKYCGLQDEQTELCQVDDEKCQGDVCSIGKALRSQQNKGA